MRRAGRVLVSAERTLVQDCSRNYATSPLFDFRRLRDRSRWISPVDETDADFKTVPVNHIGNDDSVNWAFNEYQVTPGFKTNVYRNLHLRGLQMLANGKKGKNNTLVRPLNAAPDHQIFYVASNDASSSAVPPSTWTNVSRLVKETLSGENQESLFMKDGYLGSLQVSNLPLRVLTNSGFASLFLNHAIFPTKSSVQEFYHSATIWILDSSATPFPYGKAGINSKNFTLVDKQRNRAIIVGDSLTTTALENSLVALARDFYNEKLSLLLPCDTVIDKSGKTSFIFSGDKSINLKSFDIYSSKSSLWNYFGVSRVFNSYQSNSVSSTASRGDIIEQFGNVTKFTSSENKPFPSVVSHPNSIIFFTDNPSAPGINQVSDSAQCKNLFQSSNPTGLASIADQFIANVEEDKIKCYVVNSTGNEVDALIAKTISEA